MDGKHHAIVTNIETISKVGRGFKKLWQNKDFMSKVISFVWDEAQCVSKWGDFRPEYKTAGNLRHLIPRTILFFITSAKLPPRVLDDVMTILGMQRENTYMFLRSNDQPNVHLVVRKMKYPLNSYKDLSFLIPDDLGLRASSGMYKSLCLAFFFCWRITDKSRVLKNKIPNIYKDLCLP